MKKSGIISRVTKWLLLSLAVICICMLPGNTVKAEGYNGLAVAEDGNWYLYTDGNITGVTMVFTMIRIAAGGM